MIKVATIPVPNQFNGGCAPGAQWLIYDVGNGFLGLGGLCKEDPYGKAGSISELALGAFQFCPGVYIRRRKNRILARTVFPRFAICSEHRSGQFLT